MSSEGPLYYPKADRTSQWFGDAYPGVTMSTIEKLLLHTTEGGSWPSYDGGAKAPQLTYNPGSHAWRQHFRINQSARALMDPTSTPVRENRDGVVQVEIICSCDRATADKYHLRHVTELDDQALDDLGAFAGWLHTEWGLVLAKAPVWLPYPRSGQADSAARMTSAEFDAFKGVCGHMHASGNLHGDPGSIAINQILVAAAATAGIATLEGCGMTKEQADALLKLLGEIKTEIVGMNARLGYVANDGMKDLDAVRDKIAGQD